MRSSFVLALLLGLAPLAASAAPDAPAALSDSAPEVTLHLLNVPLHTALHDLFQGQGMKYVIEPDMPNVPISLEVQNAPFPGVLRMILSQAGAVYRIESSPTSGTIYRIGSRSPAASPAPEAPAQPPGGRVSLDLRDLPLRQAVDKLFQGTGQQFAVEPAVPNYPITVRFHDVPFEAALRTLLRLAPGVTYRKEDDTYVIGMRTPQAETPAASPGAGTWVELELPAGTANQMQIQGDRVIVNQGETQVSGDVRIDFGNGMRLQTHGARVTLEKDPSGRVTRLRIEGSGR
jgi:type II secretory pathway component GspD/PulD (secretin)